MTDGSGRGPAGVGPVDLFVAFVSITVVGFGGVMPWVRWMLVEKRAWLTEEEFLNVFALSNFMPGGNVINIAVVVGTRLAGLPGAVAALTGLVAPPALMVVGVASLYKAFGDLPAVQSMIGAVAAAAAGLVVAMGIKMARPLRNSPRALAVIAAVLLAAVVLRIPLIWMLCLILPASLIAARLARR
jgi:chromate transporter